MQGFNMGRYVPPDQEGLTTGNKIHRKPPPGVKGGQLTVRFEMPFNIWCTHCDTHIGQGVRFNAEKKKVGNYYSTPIYSFRMRHTTCGKIIEIRTDPQNTDYVVTEGGKRQAVGEKEVGEITIRDPNAIDKLEDPFAALEKQSIAKTSLLETTPRIIQLQRLNDRQWSDPYEHSRKMRKIFREERTRLKQKDAATESLRDRASLHITLLDETPEDRQIAENVEFGEDSDAGVELAHKRSIFAPPPSTGPSVDNGSSTTGKGSVRRKKDTMEDKKDRLAESLRLNTRARIDPFLEGGKRENAVSTLLAGAGVRKKGSEPAKKEEYVVKEPSPEEKKPGLLVDYGSDDDDE